MVTASAQQGVRTMPVMGWGIELPEYDARVARVRRELERLQSSAAEIIGPKRPLRLPTSTPRTPQLKRLRDYGVAIKCLGTSDQLVRLPEHYAVDEGETARLRKSRAVDESR
jgi:hypothetical protein